MFNASSSVTASSVVPVAMPERLAVVRAIKAAARFAYMLLTGPF